MGADIQLAIDTLAVSAHCFDSDDQALGRNISAVTAQHEFQDIFFTWRQQGGAEGSKRQIDLVVYARLDEIAGREVAVLGVTFEQL